MANVCTDVVRIDVARQDFIILYCMNTGTIIAGLYITSRIIFCDCEYRPRTGGQRVHTAPTGLEHFF